MYVAGRRRARRTGSLHYIKRCDRATPPAASAAARAGVGACLSPGPGYPENSRRGEHRLEAYDYTIRGSAIVARSLARPPARPLKRFARKAETIDGTAIEEREDLPRAVSSPAAASRPGHRPSRPPRMSAPTRFSSAPHRSW